MNKIFFGNNSLCLSSVIALTKSEMLILAGVSVIFIWIMLVVIRRSMIAKSGIAKQLAIFKSIINSSEDFIVCKNLRSIIISWNSGAENIFGYTANEMIGCPISVLISPANQNEESVIAEGVKKGNYINKHETSWRHKNGSLIDISVTISPMRGNGDVIIGACIIGQDITMTKKSQGDLTSKAQQQRDMLDLINDGVIVLDSGFRLLYVNKRYGEMMHRDVVSLLGKCVWDEFPAAIGTATYKSICAAMNERKYYCTIDYFPPLNLWHENHVYPTEGGVFVFVRDISDYKRTEEKIRLSEKIYKTIASSIPDSLICIVDTDFVYTLVEGDMFERLGHKKEDVLGRQIIDVVNHERYQVLLPCLEKARVGEASSAEYRQNDVDTLTKFVPLKNDDGKVIAIMIVVIDVSEIKKANQLIMGLNSELEQKVTVRTEQLAHLNKELEAFSYSVAHDLRTPLRAIAGYATMLAEDYGKQIDDEGKRLLGQVEQNARKMGTLIDELLTFSKLGRKQLVKSKVNMNEIVQMSIADLHLDQKTTDSIHVDDLLPSFADPSLMRQAIINLLSNAIKYSSKNEQAEIAISSKRDGSDTTYSVCDNGVGFDMEYASNLFGVFQRMHSAAEFEGTGVGLAIVQRIVNRHNGKIWATSATGEGATFSFSLPELPMEID